MKKPNLNNKLFIRIFIVFLVLCLAFLCIVPVNYLSRRKKELYKEELTRQFDSLLSNKADFTKEKDQYMFQLALDLRTLAIDLKDTLLNVRVTRYLASRFDGLEDYVNSLKYHNMIPLINNDIKKSEYLVRNTIFYNLNMPDSAMYYLLKAKGCGINHIVFEMRLGGLYLLMDSLDRAEECFNSILEVTRKNTRAYYNLAQIYDRRGDYEKADSIYQVIKNLSYNASSVNQAYNVLIKYSYSYGRFLIRLNRPDEAMMCLKDGCDLFENTIGRVRSPNAYTNLQYRKVYIESLLLLDSLYESSKSIAVNERMTLKDSIISKRIKYNNFININSKTESIAYFNKIQQRHEKDVAASVYSKKLMNIIIYVSIYSFVLIIAFLFFYFERQRRKKNMIIIQAAENNNASWDFINKTSNIKKYDSDEKYMKIFEELERLCREDQVFKLATLNRKQLAVMLGTNENYIQTAIKLYSNGMTVSDYVNSYRIKEACEFVKKNNHAKIVEIAYECGFSNRDTFYKSFEKIMHITFKEYKSTIGI